MTFYGETLPLDIFCDSVHLVRPYRVMVGGEHGKVETAVEMADQKDQVGR
jgi:hypothetical protein